MIRLERFIVRMRYFVLISVIGLAIATGILFIKGGVDLIHFLWTLVSGMREADENIIVELMEIVHLFLVGTVLFPTSRGLYELFIQPLPLPGLIKTNSIEELELNLVGLYCSCARCQFLERDF